MSIPYLRVSLTLNRFHHVDQSLLILVLVLVDWGLKDGVTSKGSEVVLETVIVDVIYIKYKKEFT